MIPSAAQTGPCVLLSQPKTRGRDNGARHAGGHGEERGTEGSGGRRVAEERNVKKKEKGSESERNVKKRKKAARPTRE